MSDSMIPLELFTTGSSLIVVGLILYTLFSYKKKIDFVQHLLKEKKDGHFTAQDEEFVKFTFNQSSHLRDKIAKLLKTLYPVFILVAGVFFAFFDFKEALTHANIVVVTFLYLHILKVNVTSYINQLDLVASKK
mgnify:CR=1 FL=1